MVTTMYIQMRYKVEPAGNRTPPPAPAPGPNGFVRRSSLRQPTSTYEAHREEIQYIQTQDAGRSGSSEWLSYLWIAASYMTINGINMHTNALKPESLVINTRIR